MEGKMIIDKEIVESDSFLQMSVSAQVLYFHLNMAADDEGTVRNANSICKILNIEKKNIEELLSNGYLKRLSDGNYKICHWKLIHSEEDKMSSYQEYKDQLRVLPDGTYAVIDNNIVRDFVG